MTVQHDSDRLRCTDRKPQPTAIRIPELDPQLEITLELDGPDVVLRAMVTLTAPISETFPADLTGPGIFSPAGPAIALEKSEWLPEDGPRAADIISAAIDGWRIGGGGFGSENVDEYLRRHAEQALNEICTQIRMRQWERDEESQHGR